MYSIQYRKRQTEERS